MSMKPTWSPGIPLRFVERDGKKILQQVWLRYAFTVRDRWEQVDGHEWRDVPMDYECEDPSYWSQEKKE